MPAHAVVVMAVAAILAGILGAEDGGVYLSHDEGSELEVAEQQVEAIVFASGLQRHPTSGKGNAGAEFQRNCRR
ncbi:MAG: hypothetical protein OZ929_12895 [Bryobacterales bacterium]|nr:hypothetical protein [Bryobacterales bacterium]